MALVSKTIANLINGVSQQPASIRNPTQCEAQENLLSDVAFGVIHRPFSQFVAKLWTLGASAPLPFVHTIRQNSASRYKVVIKNGDLKVFDFDGVEKTVSFPDGKAYLTSTNPQEDFQCLTLGSDTYILNRTITVTEESASNSEDADFLDSFLVYIKQGDYSTDYTVTVEVTDTVGLGVTGPTSVTKTTSATVANDIKTTQIATDLKTGLDAAFPLKLNTTRSGSVLYCEGIRSLPTSAYEITGVALEDSKGNNNAKLIRSQIQKFTDLPTVAPSYWPVQVVGDKASGFDDYYVRFYPDDPNATFATGSWEESWKTGTRKRPDPSTMPLKLTDNGDGTFTCQEEEWDPREAGDTVLNPTPSFVGNTIRYLFAYGNRLGFLCGDRVIMSEVGVYTNFYLTTVTTFLDSDPIDIQPLQAQDDWLYAVPLAEKLILFSSQGQAVITGGELLTPKNATLKATTAYPCSSKCEPVILGNNLMFAADEGKFSKVYEYFVQRDVDTLDASEITSHVPKYLPQGLTRFAADDSSKMLIALGAGTTFTSQPPYDFHLNKMYVYKYHWIGDTKVQSCWSRWSLPAAYPDGYKILDASIIEGLVHLVVIEPDTGEVHLLKIDLDFSKVDSGNFAVTRTHLDFRLDSQVLTTTAVTTGVSRTYLLPFAVPSGLQASFKCYRQEDRQPSADPPVPWGEEVEITWVDDTHVTIPDDPEGLSLLVWFGFEYTSTYTFSEIHLKEEVNGVQVPVEAGKLTIKRMDVLYNESFYFRAEVTCEGRDTKSFSMSPYILGSSTALEDTTSRSGKLSFPVGAKHTQVTISIINDTVVPHRLQSAEWTGNYSILSRRV